MESTLLRKIIEGALLAANAPLSVAKLASLFELPEGSEADETELEGKPSKEQIQAALEDIQADCEGRGFELKEVGTGWRFQVVQETAPWINRLWEEKPQKYSRALLETLALIAYRQPITRGDIESIRGVAVSSTIIKTLTEREWVKVVGHRDVPGRPALYATTRQFLDYFNLKSLDELPTLKEIQDLDKLGSELDFAASEEASADTANGAESAEAQLDATDSEEAQADSSSNAEVDSTMDYDVDFEPEPEAGEVDSDDEARDEGADQSFSDDDTQSPELSDEPDTPTDDGDLEASYNDAEESFATDVRDHDESFADDDFQAEAETDVVERSERD